MRSRWRLISSSGLDHTCSGHKWTLQNVPRFYSLCNLKLFSNGVHNQALCLAGHGSCWGQQLGRPTAAVVPIGARC